MTATHSRCLASLGAPLLAIALLLAPGCAGDATRSADEGAQTAMVDVDVTEDLAPGVPGAGELVVLDSPDPSRPYFYDFGEMQHGSERLWVTRMKNVGTAPVEILTAQAGCGCTRMTKMEILDPDTGESTIKRTFAPRDVATIPAGAEVVMSVQLMSAYAKPNERKLAIFRLTTDSTRAPYLTFELSFLPKHTFLYEPKEANLLKVPITHGGAMRMKILTHAPGDPGRVLAVESWPEGLDVHLVTETFAGDYVWFLDIEVPPMTPRGAIRGKIVLQTTDSRGNGDEGRMDIPVMAQIVPDVILEPQMAAFRAFPSSVGATFRGQLTALVPGARLKVMNASVDTADPDDFEVDVTPQQPDADGRAIRWDVKVRIKPGRAAGYVSGDLVFDLEEPIGGTRPGAPNTQVRARLSGIVQEG